MDPTDVMTHRNIRSVRVKMDKSLHRGMFNKFKSRNICVASYQCDNSDFDFCIAEHDELPLKIKNIVLYCIVLYWRLLTIETKRD